MTCHVERPQQASAPKPITVASFAIGLEKFGHTSQLELKRGLLPIDVHLLDPSSQIVLQFINPGLQTGDLLFLLLAKHSPIERLIQTSELRVDFDVEVERV